MASNLCRPNSQVAISCIHCGDSSPFHTFSTCWHSASPAIVFQLSTNVFSVPWFSGLYRLFHVASLSSGFLLGLAKGSTRRRIWGQKLGSLFSCFLLGTIWVWQWPNPSDYCPSLGNSTFMAQAVTSSLSSSCPWLAVPVCLTFVCYLNSAHIHLTHPLILFKLSECATYLLLELHESYPLSSNRWTF
jgi:hypothetical protein